jgi:hypothetical protein
MTRVPYLPAWVARVDEEGLPTKEAIDWDHKHLAGSSGAGGLIGTADIATNAITNNVINRGTVAGGAILSTPSITLRAGARVLVEVKVHDTSASHHLATASTTFGPQSFPVERTGPNLVGNLFSGNCISGINGTDFYKAVMPSSAVFIETGIAAGAHSFWVTNTTIYALGMSIAVTEFAR